MPRYIYADDSADDGVLEQWSNFQGTCSQQLSRAQSAPKKCYHTFFKCRDAVHDGGVLEQWGFCQRWHSGHCGGASEGRGSAFIGITVKSPPRGSHSSFKAQI